MPSLLLGRILWPLVRVMLRLWVFRMLRLRLSLLRLRAWLRLLRLLLRAMGRWCII
jgi:hypothetical protein